MAVALITVILLVAVVVSFLLSLFSVAVAVADAVSAKSPFHTGFKPFKYIKRPTLLNEKVAQTGYFFNPFFLLR